MSNAALLARQDYSIDQFIAHTGWDAALLRSPGYKQNMRAALDYFQRVVPRHVLRAVIPDSAWAYKISGKTLNLTGWMQGIDFRFPVNPARVIKGGHRLVNFRDAQDRYGSVHGSWFAFPYTQQNNVAIHSAQQSLHFYKAKVNFTCLQSKASDAQVTWLTDLKNLPPEYRQGGAQQLFIWNARLFLDPVHSL